MNKNKALQAAYPKSLAFPLLLIALACISACSVLPKREPTAIYQPARSQPATRAAGPAAKWSLLVDKPVADEWLASERIAVRPRPGAVQVYKGASWSDSAPNLVQTALVRGFEDSQRILSVSRPGSIVRGDYKLLIELRAFESDYRQSGHPQAVIEVYAKLVHTDDGSVVAARTFKESEPSSGEDVGAVVEAFSRSLDRLSTQVVDWTLDSGNSNERTAHK